MCYCSALRLLQKVICRRKESTEFAVDILWLWGQLLPSFLSHIICFRIFLPVLEQGTLVTTIWKYCYKLWNNFFLYANHPTASASCKTIPVTQHRNSASFIMVFQCLNSKKGRVLGQNMTHQWAVSPPHNTPQEPAFVHSSPYKLEEWRLTSKDSAFLFSFRSRD